MGSFNQHKVTSECAPFDMEDEADLLGCNGEVAAYIASLTNELAAMARDSNLPMLAYLLDMAQVEASTNHGAEPSKAA